MGTVHRSLLYIRRKKGRTALALLILFLLSLAVLISVLSLIHIYVPFFRILFPGPQGCQQRADADPGGPQIVDLIDLQAGVDLAAGGKNVVYLIRGDGVQAAAEGIQLDQIQLFPCFYVVGGGVEAGVVPPLVLRCV